MIWRSIFGGSLVDRAAIQARGTLGSYNSTMIFLCEKFLISYIRNQDLPEKEQAQLNMLLRKKKIPNTEHRESIVPGPFPILQGNIVHRKNYTICVSFIAV